MQEIYLLSKGPEGETRKFEKGDHDTLLPWKSGKFDFLLPNLLSLARRNHLGRRKLRIQRARERLGWS